MILVPGFRQTDIAADEVGEIFRESRIPAFGILGQNVIEAGSLSHKLMRSLTDRLSEMILKL